MSDKSVTYKTEMLCSYWVSGRTGRKIIGLGVMIYGPSAAQSQIFSLLTPLNSVNKYLSYDH